MLSVSLTTCFSFNLSIPRSPLLYFVYSNSLIHSLSHSLFSTSTILENCLTSFFLFLLLSTIIAASSYFLFQLFSFLSSFVTFSPSSSSFTSSSLGRAFSFFFSFFFNYFLRFYHTFKFFSYSYRYSNNVRISFYIFFRTIFTVFPFISTDLWVFGCMTLFLSSDISSTSNFAHKITSFKIFLPLLTDSNLV